MLHYIALFALLAVGTLSTNMNPVTANYIVWAFGSGEAASTTYFPYAMDVCQPGSLALVYYKFTCAADGTYVTVASYSSSTCTGTPTTVKVNTTYYGVDTTLAAYRAYPGAFRCGGSDDYVTINFGTSSTLCTTSKGYVTIQASLNACTRVPASVNGTKITYSYLSVWCDYKSAELQYYVTSNCTGTVVKKYSANETCGNLFSFGGAPIYGWVVSCTQNKTGNIVDSSSDANIVSFAMGLLSLMVAILYQ